MMVLVSWLNWELQSGIIPALGYRVRTEGMVVREREPVSTEE